MPTTAPKDIISLVSPSPKNPASSQSDDNDDLLDMEIEEFFSRRKRKKTRKRRPRQAHEKPSGGAHSPKEVSSNGARHTPPAFADFNADTTEPNPPQITHTLHASHSNTTAPDPSQSASKESSEHSSSQRDPSTSLRSFLLEQVAFASQSQSHNDYYSITLRKALRNLGNKTIYHPQDALSVKGVGKKTVDRFANWLREKGINVGQTEQVSSTAPKSKTTADSSETITSSAVQSSQRSTSSSSSRPYKPKEGSIPSTILSVLHSFYNDNHYTYPSKHQLVTIIRARFSHLKRQQISSRIRDLAVKRGVVIEVNGKVELTKEGWQVLGEVPPHSADSHSSAPPRTGHIQEKTSLPTPTVVEVLDESCQSPDTSNPSQSQTTEQEDCSDGEITPPSKRFIRVSYVSPSQAVVPSKDLAAVRLTSHCIFYLICIIFPLELQEYIQSNNRIEIIDSAQSLDGSTIELNCQMQRKGALGMLYAWISEENEAFCKEQSAALKHVLFSDEKKVLSKLKSRKRKGSRRDEPSRKKVRLSEQSSTQEPSNYTHTSQPTGHSSGDSHIITFSRTKAIGDDGTSSREKLIDMYNTKLSLSSVMNTPESTLSQTQGDNNIRYQGRQYQIILLVDSRERFGHDRNAFLNSVKQNIRAEGIGLSLGDFVWVAKPVSGSIYSSYVLDLIVERKIADDLASSIRDGRKKNQNFRMKKSGISRIYYLVEGKLSQNTRFSPSALNQSMTNMVIRDQFSVIRTQSDNDTMHFLQNMTSHLIDEINSRGLGKYLIQIDEADPMTLQSFNDVGGKDKTLSYPEILGRQMYCLKGCSRDAALAIVGKYPSLFHLRQALASSEHGPKSGKYEAGELFIHQNVNIPAQGHLPSEKVKKKLSQLIYRLIQSDNYVEDS